MLPEGVDVSYTLELVREPFPFVEVTFVTRGAASGTTHLGLNNWGGVEHTENEIHGLHVTDERGGPLAVDHESPFGRMTDNSPTWVVHHTPNALLSAHYALVSTQYEVGYESSSYYRLLLEPSFFHTIGNTSLLYVRDVPERTRLHIAFHWRGFERAGWKVASSFSVGQDDFVVTESSDDFRQAVFLAGDIRLVRRDIGPTHSPLWLAITGSDWGFTDDAFADAAAAVVGAQRSFFEDYDWPFFLISVIPVGVYHRGSATQGGTGLTHSFAIFLTPKTELSTNDDGTGVTWLLSHELFHLWNGHRYELAEPEQLGYWFSEGFTNFYARRLLVRAGLASREAFVANLDDEVMRYTLSPVRGEPATRIAKDFWTDTSVKNLPYVRGDVVALLVDAEIRKESHGQKSLDDLMKGLLGARHDVEPKLTPEAFLEVIARYTSSAFSDRIRKIVVDGATAEIDPKLLEPCLHGRIERIGPYDPGFDVSALHTRGVLTGVAPDSNAYRAGLRNGQRVVSWSVRHGDPLHPLEIAIDDGGVARTFRYLPQGKPVGVVQFRGDKEPSTACASMM
jgi:predicted metalloprotease with PDZ domain